MQEVLERISFKLISDLNDIENNICGFSKMKERVDTLSVRIGILLLINIIIE